MATALASAARTELLRLAKFFHDQKNTKGKVRALLAALSTTPPVRLGIKIRLELGTTLLLQTTNPKLAEGHLLRALTDAAQQEGLLSQRCEIAIVLADAQVLLGSGKSKTARSELEKLSKANVQDPLLAVRVNLKLTSLHALAEQFDDGIAHLQQILKSDATLSSYARASYVLAIAQLYLRKRDFVRADEALKSYEAIDIALCNDEDTSRKSFNVLFQMLRFFSAFRTGNSKNLQTCRRQLQSAVKDFSISESSGNLKRHHQWLNHASIHVLAYYLSIAGYIAKGEMSNVQLYAAKALNLCDQQLEDYEQVFRVMNQTNDDLDNLVAFATVSSLERGHIDFYVRVKFAVIEQLAHASLLGGKYMMLLEQCKAGILLIRQYDVVDPSVICAMHSMLGMYAHTIGNHVVAVAHFEEIVKMGASTECVVLAKLNLALIYHQNQTSVPSYETRCREICASLDKDEMEGRIDIPVLQVSVLYIRGLIAILDGKLILAKEKCRAALDQTKALESSIFLGFTAAALANIYLKESDLERANQFSMVALSSIPTAEESNMPFRLLHAQLQLILSQRFKDPQAIQESVSSIELWRNVLGQELQGAANMKGHNSTVLWSHENNNRLNIDEQIAFPLSKKRKVTADDEIQDDLANKRTSSS